MMWLQWSPVLLVGHIRSPSFSYFLGLTLLTMGRWLVNLGVLATASGKVYFSETFGSGWESRWTSSEWKKSDGTQGTWKLSAGKWYNDESEDQGIQTAEDSRFLGSQQVLTLSAMLERNWLFSTKPSMRKTSNVGVATWRCGGRG